MATGARRLLDRRCVTAAIALAAATAIAVVPHFAEAAPAPWSLIDDTKGTATVAGDLDNVTRVRFVVDGVYQGADTTAPFAISLPASGGEHRVKARIDRGDDTTTIEARFTVESSDGAAPTVPNAPTPESPAASMPTVPPSPPTPTTPGVSPSAGTGPTINVTNTAQLLAALASAQPGQTIAMADGTYTGRFEAATPATAANPITLSGSAAAIIDGGDVSSGYSLSLAGASYWHLTGFTVRGGQKGIMVDHSNNTVLSNLDVGNTGMEAVHFRNFSSNNVIQNSKVHDTGLFRADYGEGVYLGTAKSNWGSCSSGNPDASNNNSVINNVISNTTAENIDIKEGTTGGLISGNVLDAGGITGAHFGDSLIDAKGNDYRILNNIAQNASAHTVNGFETHVQLDGWGQGNAFSGNTFNLKIPGQAIVIQKPADAPNTIHCDNQVNGPAGGLSNVACR